MSTTVPNLNKIPIEEYANLFDQIYAMLVFDPRDYLEMGQRWNKDLLELLETDFSTEGGKIVLNLENQRQEQFEKILDPLDNALNLEFDDWRNYLEKFNLEYLDVLCRNPHYAAAYKIIHKNKFSYPDFKTAHSKIGHMWEEEDYKKLIDRLQSNDFSDELEFLDIKEETTELLLINHSLNKAVEKHQLQESLDLLRECRENYTILFRVLFRDVYTRDQISKKSKTVDTEEMIANELDQEYYQKSLLEFSTNDLPHSQFSNYIASFNDNNVPQMLLDIWEVIKGNIHEFQEMLNRYRAMESWKELEQSESTLFRAIERLFVDLGFLIESVAADESEAYEKKFRKSERHRFCRELFEDLYDLDVSADGYRGVTLEQGDLPKIITCFSNPERLNKLEYLGLKETFLEIMDADLQSRELSDLSDPECCSLDELRDARWKVCRGVSLLTADIFNKKK